MAEIPVEKKSSLSWLWILLLLLLAALILWWVLADDDAAEEVVVDQTVAEQSEDAVVVAPTTSDGALTIASILENPSAYYGAEGFTGEVNVGGPLTDRGFWIENDGARMFAIVIDQPRERRIDINEGATLRLNGGTVRDPSTIAAQQIEGDALDQDTMNVLSDQEAVLVIDEANIEIVEAA
ncbi:hypothetical protein [Qipengyuania atrilutea]|uniref:Uncharacterized protein n=1 Tax=Qipengyuania atrilutea TaxID=2744473 RepID=A0A850H5Z4_9SPHN|nr:hypothetical protein [Actirhodobacter atriluteus]NVD45278.1 hypothetical protein [Actirhodobacter atriluteus]